MNALRNLKSKSLSLWNKWENSLTRLQNSRRILPTPPSRHPLILSSHREIQKATRLAKSVLSQDIPSMEGLFLQGTKLMTFKLIHLTPALIAVANFKRLKTPPELFNRLKLIKSRFILNNIPAFATGASIVRNFTTHLCQLTLRKAN